MYRNHRDSYVYSATIKKSGFNYSVYFYDLPNCTNATGNTLQNVIEEAKNDLALYLWEMERDGNEIPEPSALEDIPLEKNDTLCLVDVNMFSIRAKMDNRAVKKTLTIPWYLNDLAEKKKINFSQTLQAALKQKLGI